MRPIDLVMHDWLSLRPEERELALRDIRTLAEDAEKSFCTRRTPPESETPVDPGRRARALNIVASYFHFFGEEMSRRP